MVQFLPVRRAGWLVVVVKQLLAARRAMYYQRLDD